MWLKPTYTATYLIRQLKLAAIKYTGVVIIAVHFSERICEMQIIKGF